MIILNFFLLECFLSPDEGKCLVTADDGHISPPLKAIACVLNWSTQSVII